MATGPEGYLWLGTHRGLFRYDGHRYLSYTNSPERTYRISQNDVWNIFPTRDEKLILYNHLRTVDILDPKSNELITIDLGAKTSPRGDIRTATRESDGRIFFITEHNEGYTLFEYSSGEFIKLFERLESRLTNPRMTSMGSPRFYIALQKDGSIYLYDQENGILHISSDGQLIQRFSSHKEIGTGVSLNFFQQEDENNILLAYSEKKGVYLLDLPSGCIMPDQRFDNNYSYHICEEDEFGNLLFGMYDDEDRIVAFLIMDSKGGFTKIDNPNILPPSEQIVYGRDFLDYFYTSSSNGLIKIRTGLRHVKTYLSGQNISMRGMIEDDCGNLIIGTEWHGWYKLNLNSDSIVPIDFKGVGYQDLVPPQYARNLLRDRDGDIWISAYGNPPVTATPDGYLLRYRPSNDSILIYKNDYRIEALLYTRRGQIYLASNGILQSFDQHKGQFTDIPGNYGSLTLEGIIPNCIIQTQDGLIWVGLERGLALFDPDNQSFKFFGEGGSNDLQLSNNYIMSICEGADGLLWLGTQGGLNAYDRTTGQVKIYTVRNGLPDNNICGLMPDENGGLWISTFKGLSYFDLKSTRFRNFFTSDGFNHNEFNRHALYRSKDGIYFFGGMDGFNAFRAEELLEVNSTLKIFLSEIAFFDDAGDSLITQAHGLGKLNSVTLPASNRYLQVRFGLDNFSHPELNSYAVFLEGYDSDWVSQGNVSEVRYNNLPAGSYRLHVRGTGPSGTLSENTLMFDIHVKQFFYNSPWFYLLLMLVGSGLATLWIVRLRSEKNRLAIEVEKRTAQIRSDKETIEKQAQELLTLDLMKSRFFANISHELRTPLTLILSPLKRILRIKELKIPVVREHLELMEKNGNLLYRQIEELLELSRMEAGKIRLQENPIDLKVVVQRIVDRFRQLAVHKNIELALIWQLNFTEAVLMDVSKFDKIVGNLLGNAIKFTSTGRVEVQVSEGTGLENTHEGKIIQLSVTDTGSGISMEDLPHVFDRYFQAQNGIDIAGGTGIGLSMAKEFAELLGGTVTVESQIGIGSTFTLILPVKIVESLPVGFDEVDDLASYPQENLTPVDSNGVLTSVAEGKFIILLVEDNIDLRNFLQQILEVHYQVVAVENGKQALDYLMEQEAPVRNLLVLSDVMMPEMDGFALLDGVRSKEHLRRIPFVMLTAKAGGEHRLRALRMGVDDYLLKPFDEEELLVRIANLLSNLRMRQQLEELGGDNVDEDEVGVEWLETLENIALKSLSDPKMGMDLLAEKLNLSRSSLHRRIKTETGLTPNMYLREVRLQEARRLIENKLVMTVAEAGQQVGLQKRAYFSKLYLERFGRLPSSYFEDSSSAT